MRSRQQHILCTIDCRNTIVEMLLCMWVFSRIIVMHIFSVKMFFLPQRKEQEHVQVVEKTSPKSCENFLLFFFNVLQRKY